MPDRIIDDLRHWRQRAEEARTIAEQLSDLQAKRTMLRIADDYDRLAQHPPTPESEAIVVKPTSGP
jgi:pyruvate-formate lyase